MRRNGKARYQCGVRRGVFMIRALQGHRRPVVELRYVARRAAIEGCPDVGYHATHMNNIPSIMARGLLRGGAQHDSRSCVFLCPTPYSQAYGRMRQDLFADDGFIGVDIAPLAARFKESAVARRTATGQAVQTLMDEHARARAKERGGQSGGVA